MYGSITARCRRLTLGSAAFLALTLAPYQIALHGSALGIDAASAQAAGGGHGGGNGGGNGGGSGGGNGGGNSGGNSGNGNSGNGNGNSGGNSGKGGAASGKGQSGSHVNAATGDKVDINGSTITVEHPDGLTEKIENGRFRMQDALDRTIVDRPATPADVKRLNAL
ncbi:MULTISPECIES: hypothetical protein [Mesorhizobium]|uniref:hypothetical protein n=1 Tax=Mesorhizobium TaxID=68287 RepID=UPI0003CF65EC|nr:MULTISPECIES: hypothetical protein [Mesorhizobium]ESY62991.1 hypothetical protein X742_30965 [Mesorhizobium sp. LNHC232B00]WJI37392.1 hypothetical protein NL534_26485 [Mesorhizobium opportunistum]